MAARKLFWNEVRRRLDPIACHAIAFCIALLSVALLELILSSTLGRNAKFYDLISVRQVIGTVDLVLLVRFGFNIWREL